MRMIYAPLLFALCLLAACSRSTLTNSEACTTDAECGANAYCARNIASCANGTDTFTASEGICHRDCMGGACTCLNDADCPSSVCTNGQCVAVDRFCPEPPCTAECPSANLEQEGCPICLCSVCPNPDIGNNNADAGICLSNGGTCAQDSDCCSGNCIIRFDSRFCCEPGGCP